MTLAELPVGVACTIRSVAGAIKNSAYNVVAGVAEGNAVRVLARYPEHAPRFVEVEIAGRIVVTLPIPLTSDVALDCGCA
jgi:Fe2+ transport system protein FeoA